NLIVLLTTNLGNIPPVIYQGNPQVRLIAATLPSRTQRKAFFIRHVDDLRCQRPKASGDQLALGAAGTCNQELADTLADLTDQLKMIDLKQILSLSLSCEEPLPPEKLLNLYRFGEQRSPWEELSYDKLRQVDDTLKRRVIGQDHAVTHAATMIIRAYLGLAGLGHSGKRTKPKGTLFFVGPTGVGKTELAKAIAEFLFGDESACIRFDMSEYNHEHSDQRLVGAPPGYVGFEEGGQLTNASRHRPFSVLLFDEIEKAHGRILDKFLQIIEDGRLTDGRGETAHFSECVIIFTSNIGAAQMPETGDAETIRQHFITSVEDHFVRHLNRPELLNRIGENIVVFNKIEDPTFRKDILKKQIRPLQSHLMEKLGINLTMEPAVEQSLLAAAKSANGGRGITNAIEHKIINPCSRFLFDHFHQLRRGRRVTVENSGDKMTFELKEGDTKP
ncbi:MAG: AAA family ATPase, partial [Sedimentisphaerales bacterium]|nr:AAA family ATPase [Sedimentisphaerales bacterium]